MNSVEMQMMLLHSGWCFLCRIGFHSKMTIDRRDEEKAEPVTSCGWWFLGMTSGN